jgi:hypothetical protein
VDVPRGGMLLSVIRAWRSHEAVGGTGEPISKAGLPWHPEVSGGFTPTTAPLRAHLIGAVL